ncbi:MFS transporter [Ideonella livida]|uniref:MFS-type drug efflux transporter P55 n=1 Tax=Ideonella livida TaxID=2707176 RepID=A0A7C9PJZ9_9BURK|nr:MFS transporter [Ideonella livida]NDY93828.1 MFS transporter [Ideonella livida]
MSSTTAPLAQPQPPLTLNQPRLIHAILLLITCSFNVLVTAILGPSLPAMQAHFQDVPGVDYLVPMTMSAPLLTVAIVSVFVGELADRWGRKRLLVGSAVFYALVGTAPLYLDSLYAILASRCALGVMEAVLMTVSTTMIGDYWSGAQRDRYMSLQTTVASTSAFLFNTMGGAIAEQGWRAPYAVFAVSLVLAPLMAFFLWEPRTRASMTPQQFAEDSQSFRPRALALVCFFAVLLGIGFLTVPVHFGYLHGAIGVQSPAQIGMAYGVNSLGVISGTLIFGWVLATRLNVAWQLMVGTAIAGAGFLLMRGAGDYAALTTAGYVNGLGMGILLPAMVTWNMRDLPVSRRGMGIGAFQSCLQLGMFINPMLVVWMEKNGAGSRAGSVGYVGLGVLVLCALALIAGLRRAGARRG